LQCLAFYQVCNFPPSILVLWSLFFQESKPCVSLINSDAI
jgi:hypothetical protein